VTNVPALKLVEALRGRARPGARVHSAAISRPISELLDSGSESAPNPSVERVSFPLSPSFLACWPVTKVCHPSCEPGELRGRTVWPRHAESAQEAVPGHSLDGPLAKRCGEGYNIGGREKSSDNARESEIG